MTRGRRAAAVGIMAAIIASLLLLCTPRTAARMALIGTPVPVAPPVRVPAPDLDPIIPDSGPQSSTTGGPA